MLLDSLPSCFSIPNNSTTTSNKSSSKMAQNLVTCIYQTQICNRPVFLTLTWSRTLSSHTLTINIDSFSISVSLSQSSFSLFKNKPTSKSFSLPHLSQQQRPKLHWDFTHAQFSPASAEPISGFFVAVCHSTRIVFLLGDLHDDAIRSSGAALAGLLPETPLLSRREHVFGQQRKFSTKAWFLGASHEIVIEFASGALRLKVDGKVGLVVKRLGWKFRGKERILINGSEIDFYWDVFNWVFGPAAGNGATGGGGGGGGGGGPGVFIFQVGDGGVVWPEIAAPEKRLLRKSFSAASPAPTNCSVLQWAEERSEGGSSRSCSSSSSSWSSSSSSVVPNIGGGGFTLLLYAWRTD